jgi:flagellar basal-body rod protein FlgG
MAAQQQRIDAVSNDVANVSTAGYKRERLSFRDLAYQNEATGNGVRAGAGSAVASAGRSQVAGSIQITQQPLDVAIEGDGYLTVRRPDGQLGLTRQGALQVDGNRRLTSATGDLLEPPITIPANVDLGDLEIGSDGTVSGGGRTLGRIQLQTVPAPAGQLDAGDSVMLPTTASGGLQNAPSATLQQGALEMSNVDMSDAMVDLMDAQRSYSMLSKVLQTQDQLMEIANQVKR